MKLTRYVIVAILGLATGCTSVKVMTPNGTYIEYRRFIYDVNVKHLDFGGLKIEDYEAKPNAETSGKVAEGVVGGLKKF